MDLNSFCARQHDPRPHLHTPMRVGNLVVATNGHILIALPDMVSEFPEAPAEFGTKVTSMLAQEAPAGEPVPLATIDLPERTDCPDCGGDGFLILAPCPECEGKGDFWHGTNLYECKECFGNGTVPAAIGDPGAKREICVLCDGDGAGHQAVEVNGVLLQRRYLALLKALPGCTVAPNGDMAAHFRFDAGHGLLMPCRR